MCKAETTIGELRNIQKYDYKAIAGMIKGFGGKLERKMKDPDVEFWRFSDGSMMSWKNPGNKKKAPAVFIMPHSDVEYLMSK